MTPPGVGGFAVFRRIPVKTLSRLAVFVQEVRLDPIKNPTREARHRDRTSRNHPDIPGQDRPAPVEDRAVGDESLDAPCQACEHRTEPFKRLRADSLGREIPRAASTARSSDPSTTSRRSSIDANASLSLCSRSSAKSRRTSRRCASGRG